MSSRQFNLADLFETVVDTVPERLALVAGVERRTYRQLDERSNRFAHHLEGLGLAAGSHVGILANNRVEWAEAMIGCYKARIVPVNLNYRYVAPELRYVIENAELELLVFEETLAPLVTESLASPASPGEHPRPVSLRLMVLRDGPGATLSKRDAGLPGGEVAVPALDADHFEDAIESSSPERNFEPRSPDDIYVLYTGGTTGLPKGVLWRQEDIFFAAMGGGGWGAKPIAHPDELAGRINPDDGARAVLLVMAPLMHGNAQWVMWNGFMMGGTAVLYTEHRYDPDRLWRLVEEERVVSIGLVGDAMARPLAEALDGAPSGRYDTSSLLVIGSGGAMLSSAVKAELKEHLPHVMVMDRFGSSESGAHGAVEEGAVGPRFMMDEDTSVLDDDLRPLVPGDGRIGRLARTGRIPLGYFKDQVKTDATFPVDADGVRWSVPGDLASVELDGSITVLGRGSTSINTGGEKVFPEEVEAVVKSHPDVFDAIVVGIPDDRFGERVAVVVQPRLRHGSPTLEGLQEHCRGHIAGYKVPRQLVEVDSVPLTAAGKPDAKGARELF
ncbi:MAG: acyl-CoA synthetase [Acidimicrobiales bacterium]